MRDISPRMSDALMELLRERRAVLAALTQQVHDVRIEVETYEKALKVPRRSRAETIRCL